MNIKTIILQKLGMFSALWLILSLFTDGTQSNPSVTLIMVFLLTWISYECEKMAYWVTISLLILKDMRIVNQEKSVMDYFKIYRFGAILFGIAFWMINAWSKIEVAIYQEARDSYTDSTFLLLICAITALYLESFIINEKMKNEIETVLDQRKKEADILLGK